PHGLTPCPLEALTECDVGRWEGLNWHDIASQEPELYQRFLTEPWECAYPGGESLRDVQARTASTFEHLFTQHEGESVLVVAHQVVFRAYLAPLLGLVPGRA